MCIRDSNYTGTASLSDTHTLAELKTVNNGTTNTITLNDYSVALTGSTADVKAALAGTFASTYTGNVTLSDANTTDINATDITTIEADTTGTITVSNAIDINGTAAEVAAAVDDVNTFSGTPTATLTSAHTLAELKAINNKLSGTLTLNDYTVALCGSSSDVEAALDGTFAAAYTGTASVNDAHTLAQLKTINNGTTGQITLTDYTVALSGSTADVKAALDGSFASAYTGNVTISDANTIDITATDITQIEAVSYTHLALPTNREV